MCWSAPSSLAGFGLTWVLGVWLWTGARTPYDQWTAAAMMTVALIQLLEFFAWTFLHDPERRRRVARLLRPALLAQPAVSFAMAAYALSAPWMLPFAALYALFTAFFLVNVQQDADILVGQRGHLAWHGNSRERTTILQESSWGWVYMIGVFAPFVVALLIGNSTYAWSMFLGIAGTFVLSSLAYSKAEASSMWCFWGLVLTCIGWVSAPTT